jgi:hypothetical protein
MDTEIRYVRITDLAYQMRVSRDTLMKWIKELKVIPVGNKIDIRDYDKIVEYKRISKK